MTDSIGMLKLSQWPASNHTSLLLDKLDRRGRLPLICTVRQRLKTDEEAAKWWVQLGIFQTLTVQSPPRLAPFFSNHWYSVYKREASWKPNVLAFVHTCQHHSFKNKHFLWHGRGVSLSHWSVFLATKSWPFYALTHSSTPPSSLPSSSILI